MVFAVVSCVDEETYYVEYGDVLDSVVDGDSDYGYLSLSDMSVSLVQVDEEFIDSSESLTKSSTRADGDEGESDDVEYRELSDSELAECWMTITSSNLKEAVQYEMTFEEFYTESTDESGEIVGYPLIPAQYDIIVDNKKPSDVLTAVNSVVVASAATEDLGEPMYRGYGEFEIQSNSITESAESIKCDLNNVKASLELSADLKAMFKPTSELDTAAGDIPLNVAVSMGYQTYVFDGTEDEDTAVYFDLLSVGKLSDDDNSDTITIVLSGMYNTADGSEEPSYAKISSWKQEITGVAAGQSRKIGIRIEHTNEGTVEFVITVENWVYNEKIDVDIMTAYANGLIVSEETIVDPESLPRIQLMDGDDNVRFIPMEGDTANLEYQFTPRGETATIAAIVATTSNIYGGAEMVWTPEDQDLGQFAALFEASVSSINSKVSIAATDSSMTTFFRASAATYTTTFTVLDSEGRESVGTCVVNVGEATAPTVVWRDKDIYVRQEITADGLDFIIDITSSTSITGFTVDIVSDVLSAEELLTVNLSSHMDLINPDASYVNGLSTLGFPMGDDILGKTEMVFDVSDFMESLYLFGEGDSDFTLTITNSAGKSTVATAGVYVGSTDNPEFERPEGTGDVTITWDGYDFDTRYDISPDNYPTVVIDVVAVNGISSLVVNINSDVLDEAELESMNLSTEMDLVNPATDDMNSGLSTVLGFPTKDEVEGETSVTIDITDFIPTLSLLGAGESDFTLSVTDSKGEMISKTLMFNSTYVKSNDDEE